MELGIEETSLPLLTVRKKRALLFEISSENEAENSKQ
jgi:hypothetical protein